MDDYKQFVLGPGAREYLLECLGEGLTLSRFLRQRPELGRGRVYTRFPDSIQPDSLERFETGGVLSAPPGSERYGRGSGGALHRMVPIVDTSADLARLIQGFLGGGSGRVCLFENWLAKPGDPWLASASSRVLSFGDEVYHVLCGSDTEPNVIESAIREAKSIPIFVGALSFSEQSLCSPGKREIAREELESLAERAEKIIVGAYDGEGYLIWDRS